MDPEKRKRIVNNVEKLVSETNFDDLLKKCLERNLLNQKMKSVIEKEPMEIRHKRLFYKITHRGPDAYEELIHILKELHYYRALILLNEDHYVNLRQHNANQYNQIDRKASEVRNVPTQGCHPTDDEDDFKFYKHIGLKPYTKDIKPLQENFKVIKSTEIHHDNKIGTYPMISRDHRGVFLMVNIIDFPNTATRRYGAEKDGQSLLYLFKNLGFTLFAYNNLKSDEFFTVLKMIIESEYTRQTECFVMALMTHGHINESSVQRVQFHDGINEDVSRIEGYFGNNVCPNLVNKPKILLFPFCRGDYSDSGTIVYTDGQLTELPRNIATHSHSDILICYASTRGYQTHRDTDNGSWYIQKFCEIMAKNAHNTNFDDILKLVQRETGTLRTKYGRMQMGTHENNGFNKKLFFNPGVWLDENKQLHIEAEETTTNTTSASQ